MNYGVYISGPGIVGRLPEAPWHRSDAIGVITRSRAQQRAGIPATRAASGEMAKRERHLTPPLFAEWLISIAASARRPEVA